MHSIEKSNKKNKCQNIIFTLFFLENDLLFRETLVENTKKYGIAAFSYLLDGG